MNEPGRAASATNEYRHADHARRHRSTAGSQEAMPSDLRERCLADLDRDGFTIIENVFDAATVESIRSAVEPLFVHEGGRNAFEGFDTRRLYSPLDDTDALDPMVEHPYALGVLDELFEPNYLLSQLQVIDIAPGEKAQGLHVDDTFYPWPRPRPQENFSLSVSRERVARSSDHMQRLLGYSIHPPFMGFVRGMHPKRILPAVGSQV